MRRRWKALVAVGAVALLVVVYFWRIRDDGLNWVRKYKPKEQVSHITYENGQRWKQHRFEFEVVPNELRPELMKFLHDTEDDKGWTVQMGQGLLFVSRRMD